MTVYVTGDSHVVALAKGYRPKGPDRPALHIFPMSGGPNYRQPFFRESGDKIEFLLQVIRDHLELATGRPVIAPGADIWGICMGFWTGFVFKHAMWRDYLPYSVKSACHQPISERAVREIAKYELRHVVGFYKALTALRVKWFAISGPPPRATHPAVTEIGREAVLEIDRHCRRYLLETLRELRIGCVLPPAITYDPDGYLGARFCSPAPNDHIHANPIYGRMMTVRITTFVANKMSRLTRSEHDPGRVHLELANSTGSRQRTLAHPRTESAQV